MTTKILALLPLAVAFAVASAHSQTPPAAGRVVTDEHAYVALKDDNRVPATEIGMLTHMHVKEGQSVKEGDLLATIDERETLAKRRVAEGEVRAAQTAAENDAEIEVAVKAIQVALAEYQALLDVNKDAKGAVSQSELRKNLFQWERAIAQEKLARNENLIAKVTVEVKTAQHDATAIELDRRQIKAPFSGQVIEIIKNTGDWVQAGEPIMHIVGLEKVKVVGRIEADSASPAEVLGKPVTITVNTAGKKTQVVKGIIGFASPLIEDGDLFRVWAEVENERIVDPVTKLESWKIQPGAKATMKIDLAPPLPARPAVPSKASPGKAEPGVGITPTSNSAPGAPAVGNAWKGKAAPPAGNQESFKPVTGAANKAGQAEPKTPPPASKER